MYCRFKPNIDPRTQLTAEVIRGHPCILLLGFTVKYTPKDFKTKNYPLVNGKCQRNACNSYPSKSPRQ